MSEYETITLDATRAGIAILTLNRPDKHNAFNSQVIAELTDALETLEEQDTLRMVILRGAGKSFSAGADLKLSVSLWCRLSFCKPTLRLIREIPAALCLTRMARSSAS